jgi:uncharacterized protein YmfQ (DUF2313 family)
MTLEQTTELYASVLRQLLPVGGYDASPNTEALAVDVYAHAKLLAQADLDAKRLLKVLEGFPPELISEYETEYGLPLKCTVNAGKTLEERLEILKWVRSTRNVLNRAYLEQILAIFGVVLIDIVKFKPLLCTAPCNSAVNTEQLRYKVLLELQYPVNADLNCIIENYLPNYLRIDLLIDMPWSDWILNAGVTVNTSGIAHYTAYKTNQRDYYDSYADLNLTDVIIRSFHDADMQQWQGFKDATNELTGVTDWVVDADNKRVEYNEQLLNDGTLHPDYQYNCGGKGIRDTVTECGQVLIDHQPELGKVVYCAYTNHAACTFLLLDGRNYSQHVGTRIARVDPYPVPEKKYVAFADISQQIISNIQSPIEGTSLLTEAYVEAVAKSIFAADESKQFVKQADLLSQLELNKILRT